MGRENRADLHMHTTASDGTLTPEEVVQRAKARKLAAIAITDHDTVEAHRGGGLTPEGLEVIAATELSCDTDHGEFHLLGYFLDAEEDRLDRRLEELKEMRIGRFDRIVSRLAAVGCPLPEDVRTELRERSGALGRPHVARAMVDQGYVRSVKEAFDVYLARGGKAFVPRDNRLTPREAILLVRQAGGVPVAAHPGSLFENAGLEFLDALCDWGLEGVEAHHPSHSSSQVKACTRAAEERGLIVTAGSDFHSDRDSKRHASVGSVTVRMDVVERLREKAGQIRGAAYRVYAD